MLSCRIIPTVLAYDPSEFIRQFNLVRSLSDWIQIDSSDGRLVPGEPLCQPEVMVSIENKSKFEVHLMVEEPINHLADWQSVGASRVIGHVEKMSQPGEFIQTARRFGLEVGLAFQVETSIKQFENLIGQLDLVLLMGHRLGVQNLPLDESVLEKISEIRQSFSMANIEVDGGINRENIAKLRTTGANYFAIGSAISQSNDPMSEFDHLLKLIQ